MKLYDLNALAVLPISWPFTEILARVSIPRKVIVKGSIGSILARPKGAVL